MLECSKPSLPGLQTCLHPCSPLPSSAVEKVFHVCWVCWVPVPGDLRNNTPYFQLVCLPLLVTSTLKCYHLDTLPLLSHSLCCPTVVSVVSSLQLSKAISTSVSLLLAFQSVSLPTSAPTTTLQQPILPGPVGSLFGTHIPLLRGILGGCNKLAWLLFP